MIDTLSENIALGLLLVGLCIATGAAYFGVRFYPPGYDYELEAKNNRIAGRLSTVAVAFIVAAIILFLI